MSDLLIEFLNEEMPASFLKEAAENINNKIKNSLIKEDIVFKKNLFHFTPKRIAVIFLELKCEDDYTKQLIKGPRFGSPEAAVNGFAKSFSTTKSKLTIKNTEKGKYYFFKNNVNRVNIKDLLISILESELQRLNWKKSMRWGSNNIRWARPLKNILCLYNNKKLPLKYGHLSSSNETLKLDFLIQKKVRVKSVKHYYDLMQDFKVIIKQEDRQKKILLDGEKLLKKKNLHIEKDEKLLNEVSNLVETPYLFLAKFRECFLSLPQEILITTMKKNQKYFPLYSTKNKLSNYFLLVSNSKSNDKGKTIIKGNQRVVNARLEDAVFFWNLDRKYKIEYFHTKLNKIIFHNELGSIKQKVTRLGELARHFSKKLKLNKKEEINLLKTILILKNDLASEVVKEFPELQGIIGAYYAKESKFNDNIVNAVCDQYKPLGPNDILPRSELAKIVSFIDKIDTIVGFFIIGRHPTSSKDPFALRRMALGIIRILIEGKIQIDLTKVIVNAINCYKNSLVSDEYFSSKKSDLIKEKILSFILDRYENLIKDSNVASVNLFNSLKINLTSLNISRLHSSLIFLDDFFKSKKGLKLLNAIKRVANIINIEDFKNEKKNNLNPNTKLFNSDEELRLYEDTKFYTKNNSNDYRALMKSLLFLVTPIENFFDNVQIHHQNDSLRKNRLLLLLFVNNRVSKTISFYNLIKGSQK